MRFLSVNHLRLGSSPGGIPAHLTADTRGFSTRTAWQRAIATAVRERVHAVVLSGQVLAPANTDLEPWGPLCDGLADLQRAGIPVVAIENGDFTAHNLSRYAPEDTVVWLTDMLAWEPVITTSANAFNGLAVHIVSASLAESSDVPVSNPITMNEIDQSASIWLLTDPLQPDQFSGDHALVVEPGSVAPLSSHETGRHGAWLIDTDTREAHLIPLANLEYAAVDIDIHQADALDALEHIISSTLAELANNARSDGSITNTMLVDITLSGSSRLYAALADTANELQRMLVLEQADMEIGIGRITIDATPEIDLEPLLNRPDPVGEIARLIHALTTGSELSTAQSRLLTATEQRLLTVSHARVFGSILDLETDVDAPTLLRRQGWATLDALVRQRGIDS